MKNIRFIPRLLLMALVILTFSCEDETEPPVAPKPVVDFTFAADAINPLMVKFTNSSTNAATYSWDFGDGSAVSTTESPSYTYAEAGTYDVVLTAANEGESSTVTKKVTVTASGTDPDPQPEPTGNLIEDGNLNSEEAWTITQMGGTALTTTEFTASGLVVSNEGPTAQSNVAVWQAVEVISGQDYKFSANVSGAGTTNSWVQVKFGKAAPVSTTDYTEANFIGLNSFADANESNPCGLEPFNGDLALIGCEGDGKDSEGVVTFAESGTIYVVIKAGSWDGFLGDGGVIISDMSLVAVTGDGGGGVAYEGVMIDFETEATVFTPFGGSTFEIVENPDPTGINNSAKVGKTIHGPETWAGLTTELAEAIDLSKYNQLAVKVWAPVTGKIILKVENGTDNTIAFEETLNVDVANEWVEVVLDLSGANQAASFEKIAIFAGYDTTVDDTYYIDDIQVRAAQ